MNDFNSFFNYQSAYVVPGNDNDVSIRINPFTNICDTEDIKDGSEQSSSSSNFDNILVSNDHFQRNLTYNSCLTSVESLSVAVKECRLQILNTVDDPDEKAKLIESLIQLNERLHFAKETRKTYETSQSFSPKLSLNDDRLFIISGHALIKTRNGLHSSRRCEVCSKSLITSRSIYSCKQCVVVCHAYRNCLYGLRRTCPSSGNDYLTSWCPQTSNSKQSATINSFLNIETFPMTGNLTSQNFFCIECHRPLQAISKTDLNNSERSLTRFCHYSNKFYCSNCHWDNKYFIPSVYFIINKWKRMSVGRSAFITLTYLWDKALFRMPQFWELNNPRVDNVLIIRRKLFSMRSFIHNCQSLRKICQSSPEWVIDQPYLVSMKFVEGICDGSVLETVQILYSAFVAHIPQCEKCLSLCTVCDVCKDPEVLYVMSRTVWTCSICFMTCIHESCGLSRFKEKSNYICYNCSK